MVRDFFVSFKSGCSLFAVKLVGIKPVVVASLFHERLVAAPLHNLPMAEHQDDVAVADGGEPVSDDEAGAADQTGGDSALDQLLRFGVHRARGLIQDKQAGII